MRAVLVILVIVLGGCPYTVPKYDYAKEPDPRNKELVLGVGDAITINVWENKDLSIDTTIRADGNITMPLVGDVKAAGETPTSLKQLIRSKVERFVRIVGGGSGSGTGGGEQVTVGVKSWRSYRFTIQGEVVKQGMFTSDQFVTVSDAIAMAGGLTRYAKHHELKLFRTDPATGKVRTIPLDYDLVASGVRLDMNIYMLAGDTLYCP
jgi:polysaccharide export outer membrane protein